MRSTNAELLADLYAAGVNAVSGEQAVIRALQQDEPFAADLIIAVGKAASSMCLGALHALPKPCPALVITKYEHVDTALSENAQVKVVESGHPIPDENSLLGGKQMLEAVKQLDADSKLLLLVSGGASALAECLSDGMTLKKWQQITKEMIASGCNIAQINTRRKQTSLLKDGKLLQDFRGSEVRVYAISDVEGDDIAVIGSGVGNINRLQNKGQVSLIGSNQMARNAVASAATDAGYNVQLNEETLYQDVAEVAPRIAKQLIGAAAGVYIWGGEPTIELPQQTGNGGRNQSLALMIARRLVGQQNITVLVAGTDGSDGPTDAAGAIVDAKTAVETTAAADALSRADAGTFLRQTGDIFITGPSNTNVMDLAIAVVS